nr:glycosyltransferase family 4 protein [uncultured Campylobacter sp.]
MKKILFVDTGREYGGGTKSFLYLLRGLAAQQKYELCAFFETDYEAGGRNISQIIEEYGAKFIKFEPKKQPSKLKKELLRALGGQILARYLYKKDYDYALCLLRQVQPDVVHLNNHFSTNLSYISAANSLNIAVVQHLRKNSAIEPFKLEILKRLKFTPVCVSNATYDFYAVQIKMPKNVVYNPVEAPVLKREKSEASENLSPSQANLKNSSDDKSAALKAKFDAEKINIVMPANFLTLKGHELVFDALARLKRSDIKVYFAGAGELKAGAKAKFDALIKSGKAEYLGFVSKMDEIYAACDYVLGFSSDEGLPRVVIEALGCGLGVVYSDIAVIREIYEISSKKQDFFIVQRSSDALLACFESLRKPSSKSPDDAAIKAFSIENYLRGIDRIYSEL